MVQATSVARRSEPVSNRPTIRHRKINLVSVGSLVIVLVVWEIVGRQINPIFASYPSAIASAFVEQVRDGTLGSALLDSLQPLALGYVAAAVVGITLGLLIGRYRYVESAIGFYVTAGYAMPLVALVPLFLLWFGLGFTVKVAIVFFMTVYPIIISTWAGVNAVPRTMIEVARSFVAPESAIMRKIVLPATVPHIMTGLRLGIGRAVIAVVIAEFFTAINGLGGLVLQAGQRFDTAALFVPVVTLLVIAVGLNRLVQWLESVIAPWHRAVAGSQDR